MLPGGFDGIFPLLVEGLWTTFLLWEARPDLGRMDLNGTEVIPWLSASQYT